MSTDFNNEYAAEAVKKDGIKLGIFLGVLSLVINIVSFYVLANSTNFKTASLTTGGISILLIIGFSAYFAVVLRKSAGGFWTFSEALKGIFTMLAVSVILSSVGTTVFNLIKPELQQIIFDKTINFTIEAMESVGAEDDRIDKQVADLEKTRDDALNFSVGQTLKALGVSLIMYFVFALILAAILKREKPAFLNIPQPGDGAHPWQDKN